MIVFLASSPITIHFFFRKIISFVATRSPVQVLIDRTQNPLVFDGLRSQLNGKIINLCIPRKLTISDFFYMPSFVFRIMSNRQMTTLVSCSPKASLYAAVCRFLVGWKVTHIYLIQGSVWDGKKGLRVFLFRAVERFILLNSDARLSVSASEVLIRLETGMIPEGAIDLINRGAIRGVPPKFFDKIAKVRLRKKYRRQLFGEEESELTVLGFIGRLNDDKGISTILDWYEQEWVADPRMALLFVGPDEMSDSLRSRFGAIKRLAENSRRAFIHKGFVDEPLPYFTVIDFFLMPSKREGFGIAAIEAAASGAIVIASDIGGLKDALGHGNGGVLVRPETFGSVPKLIYELLGDASSAKLIRDRAQTFVEKNFSSPLVEKNIADYIVSKAEEFSL